MFVSAGQIYVFIACYAFGAIIGVLFSVKNIILLKNSNLLKIILDVITLLLISILYCLYAKFLYFPNFRAYMVIAVFLGINSYLKSFNIILAKSIKKTYNIIKRICLRMNKAKDDRIKN